mmetsp:Transcript_719/g.1116  ORF Transcript_719/g.1116 Transcript_719/m.1116 type:complete len:524 (-) Transcript_719:30-1601(-)
MNQKNETERGEGTGGGELFYDDWDKNVYINFINTFNQPKENKKERDRRLNLKKKKKSEGQHLTSSMPCFEIHSIERSVIQKLSLHNKELVKQKELLKKRYEALKKQHELAIKASSTAKIKSTIKNKELEKLEVKVQKWMQKYKDKEEEMYRMEEDHQKQIDQAQKEIKNLYKQVALGESEIEVARNDVRRNSLLSIQDVQRYKYLLQLEKQKTESFQRRSLENELAQMEAKQNSKILNTIRKKGKEQEKQIIQLEATTSRLKYDLKNAKEELKTTKSEKNSLEKKYFPLKAEHKRIQKILANYKRLFENTTASTSTKKKQSNEDFLNGTDIADTMNLSPHMTLNAGRTPIPEETPQYVNSTLAGRTPIPKKDKREFDFIDIEERFGSPNNIDEIHSQFASIISEPSPSPNSNVKLSTSFRTPPKLPAIKSPAHHITANHNKNRMSKKYNFENTTVYDDMNPPVKNKLDTSVEPYKKPLTHTSPKNAKTLSKSQLALLKEMASETSSIASKHFQKSATKNKKIN